MNRLIIIIYWMLLSNSSHVMCQTYFDQIVIPQLFNNVYQKKNGQKTRFIKCTLNDTLFKEIAIRHQENGSIKMTTSTEESTWVTQLIFDNSNHIVEFGTTSDLGGNYKLYYEYSSDSIQSIEHYERGIKKWISTLNYAQDGHLKGFHQLIFHNNDSLVEVEHKIQNEGNQLIITNQDSREKYFFNDQGQCVSHYINDELTFKAEYNNNGRVLSETYYWDSIEIDDIIHSRDLFFYDEEGVLVNVEYEIYRGGKLYDIIYCNFYSAD